MADRIAAAYEIYFPQHARGRLIDLGCGKVPLYEAYKDYVTEIVCVDWDETLHGTEHLDYRCDLSRELPFRDAEFDTIVLSDVLEHVPEPERLWRELARLLTPAGKGLINVPFYYYLHETPHDYYRYTEYALRRFAERAGLQVLVLQPLGGSPEVIADLLAKHFAQVPLIGGPMAAVVQSAAALFGRTRFGRRLSEKSARAFPLGYFLVVRKPESQSGPAALE